MRSKLKTRLAIVILLAILAAIVISIGETTSSWTLKVVGLLIAVIALIINLTIRCPNCGRCLTAWKRAYRVPHHCPECGTAITDERTVE